MEKVFEFKPAFEGQLDSGRRSRTYKALSKSPGVYFIKENGVIVYVGMSIHCVVKACYRHFYQWNGYRQGVTYYKEMLLGEKEYSVMIFPVEKDSVYRLEQSLIMTFHPRDNKERYEEVKNEILNSKGYVKASAVLAEDAPLILADENYGLPF